MKKLISVILVIFLITIVFITACTPKQKIIGEEKTTSDTDINTEKDTTKSPEDLSEVNSLDQDLNSGIDDLAINLNEEDLV